MNQKQRLKQARKGIKFSINESPETGIIYRKSLKSDGFGGLIEDPFGEEEINIIKYRLSHEKKLPGNYEPSPAGFTSNYQRFILVDYETIIYENDVFESEQAQKRYKIGVVDPLIKFGGVIGYQAPLIEAENIGG
jgi:hypothetical protein